MLASIQKTETAIGGNMSVHCDVVDLQDTSAKIGHVHLDDLPRCGQQVTVGGDTFVIEDTDVRGSQREACGTIYVSKKVRRDPPPWL